MATPPPKLALSRLAARVNLLMSKLVRCVGLVSFRQMISTFLWSRDNSSCSFLESNPLFQWLINFILG